ncbi:hypothetical protein [Rhodococcus zopfii]|nr:hypothetical protein [Rhodococcus zopfii]
MVAGDEHVDQAGAGFGVADDDLRPGARTGCGPLTMSREQAMSVNVTPT